MSNLAQEEADRFFSYKPSATSHPEDAHQHGSGSDRGKTDDDDDDDDDHRHQHRSKAIRSRDRIEAEDPDLVGDDLENDDNYETTQNSSNQANNFNKASSYSVPSTRQYANTGPKGVIADAQNYHRAKRDETRVGSNKNKKKKTSSNNQTFAQGRHPPTTRNGKTSFDSNSDSEAELLDLLEDESNDNEDSAFMQTWRAKRMAEIQAQYPSHSSSPSTNNNTTTSDPNLHRRTWGHLEQVNSTGYISALESTDQDSIVVVFLFDPLNGASLEVEDELKMLAYTWNRTRFIKMHHSIAEMQSVEIPAVLVYRGGDVVALFSGLEGGDGLLEEELKGRGFLKK